MTSKKLENSADNMLKCFKISSDYCVHYVIGFDAQSCIEHVRDLHGDSDEEEDLVCKELRESEMKNIKYTDPEKPGSSFTIFDTFKEEAGKEGMLPRGIEVLDG